MPMQAPRALACGCRALPGELCEHQRARRAEAERRRPTARQRGYTSKWERESKAFLALPANRYCCCGCGRPADAVDHRVAHKGDQRLFWDRSNWQPMARGCNSAKAARSEGGFGNPTGPRPQTFSQGERTAGDQPRVVFTNSTPRTGAQ